MNDNRYAVLRLYAITGGCEIYDLILLFGNKATSRYARGLHLMDCIPAEFNDANMWVDEERREIVVGLE